MLFVIWKFFHPYEYREVLFLQEDVEVFLMKARLELTGNWEHRALMRTLNEMLHQSGLHHAWGGQGYNPSLGTLYKAIGNQLVTVSIGLRKDRFTSPCAIFHIVRD